MSSFTIGAVTVNFDAVADFNDELGLLEEITVGILVDNPTDWGALATLRSPQVSIRPSLSGGAIVDYLGGAGPGALAIDNLDAHTALLTKLGRTVLEPGTGRCYGAATFLITA